MHVNPILINVREAIEAHPSGVSEYALLVALQENEAMQFNDIDPNLVLFRKHFLLMNALYQIQEIFIKEGRYLSISPLEIRLQPLQQTNFSSLPAQSAEAKMRDYYLDWDNFNVTVESDIDKLLTGFWARFLAVDKRVQALQILELPADAELSAVKQRYRRLVREFHPDKGGDANRFREIREAYEILLRSGLT